MAKKNIKNIILILFVILIFIIGVWLEIDYRILTRKSIKYFAKYKMDFYGAKDFRFFQTDIALILILIPISHFFLTNKIVSFRTKLKLTLLYLLSIIGFYCLYWIRLIVNRRGRTCQMEDLLYFK